MKKGFCKRGHSGEFGQFLGHSCVECVRQRRNEYYTTADCRFTFSKRHAARRGLEWEISKEDFVAKFSNLTCFYCDVIFKTTGTGLDRADNSKGYTLDNVVMCCTDCNKHKLDTWTVQEAKVAITAVKEYRKINGF